MTDINIRKLQIHELANVFEQIEKDFAPGEYPPYPALRHQIEHGLQEGLIMQAEGKDVAYSFCAANNPNAYVLISLLAVDESCRGKGFGSLFLEELKKAYPSKNGLIVEVEKPEDTESQQELAMRLKRVDFYKKSGFQMIPNVEYSIWDIPMDLLVFPMNETFDSACQSIGQVMYDIYLDLLGKRFIHKMHFKAL